MRRLGVLLYLALFGAAAMAAAAAGHAVIAVLTRFGVVGGVYATYRHEAIVPAIVAAGAIACGVAAFAVVGAVADALRLDAKRAGAVAFNAVRAPLLSTWVFTYVLQLGILILVESVEQAHQFGHPLGFGAALGAPALPALLIHAACAACFVALASRAILVIARTAAHLAAVVPPLVWRLRCPGSTHSLPAARRFSPRSPIYELGPLAFHIANRPPPSA